MFLVASSRCENNKNTEQNELFDIDESLPSFLHVPFKELKFHQKGKFRHWK